MSAQKRITATAVALFLLLTVIATAAGLFTAPAVAKEAIRVAIDCPLYKNAEFSEEFELIPQNAEVSLTGDADANGFVQVAYGTMEGYVLARNLYRTSDEIGTETVTVRVTSAKIGSMIDIKKYPMESETIATLKDGTRVDKVVGGVEYGDYTEIIFNGERAYVPTVNITDGVTYYQTVVIILCVAAFVLLGCAVAIIAYGKKRKAIMKRGQNGVL